MRESLNAEKNWSPHFPKSKEGEVKLLDCEFQTFVPDRRPGIFVQDQPPFEDPACFWVDYEHVYLRINWSTWGKVSVSSPDQVIAICNTHFCRITHSSDNVVKDYTAPVYRIAALPDNLFCKSPGDEKKRFIKRRSKGKNEYKQSIEKISKIVKDISKDLGVYPGVNIEGNRASVVVFDQTHSLIMDLLPEDREFFFIQSDGKNEGHSCEDSWPTRVISLEFLEDLRRIKKLLAKKDPNNTVYLGVLANTWTIGELRTTMENLNISDFRLFSYADLKKGITNLFFPKKKLDPGVVSKRVKEIIAKQMGVDESRVREEARLVEDLGADELDLVEVCMAIEEAFDMFFPDEVFSRFQTVKDIIDYLEKD